MDPTRHRTAAELEAGLPAIRRAPHDRGVVEMIVRRPQVDEREQLAQCELDCVVGLVGDSWLQRGGAQTTNGSADPLAQLTIMNARVADLVAGETSRWPLAGDQLYVDLDLSEANLPAGTRLAIGAAVIELTATPHTGCGKFRQRFGPDAMGLVNSPEGRALNLRGRNARVVVGGVVRVGDLARKQAADNQQSAMADE
jgi:hypothetical protein